MFRKCTCVVCNKNINSLSDCEELVIHIFGEKMIKFVKTNIWLEHGVNNLLSKKNFKTFTGVYILGHSGVKHEVDNFAEITQENIRILGECKGRDIGVNDVLILSGKMQDTGISVGYIFTTSSTINKDIKKLARFRNITIVDSILERKDLEILEMIR